MHSESMKQVTAADLRGGGGERRKKRKGVERMRRRVKARGWKEVG